MGEFDFKTTRFDCTEFYILINHLVSRRLQIINFDLLINFYLIINFYLLINFYLIINFDLLIDFYFVS
jgi:hypothetical protein